jgi:opacity protein-like surface antigen
MLRNRILRTTVLSVVTFGSIGAVADTVHAADNGIYLGAGVTRSSIDTSDGFIERSTNGFGLHDHDNGYKLIAGFRPLDWLAVETNYIDFGKVHDTNPGGTFDASYKLRGVDAFAVGMFALPFVDLYAKAGLIRWDAKASVSSVASLFNRHSDDGTDFAYGAGVQARLGSLGGRLEYERFNVPNTDKVAALSLAITWTFL